MGTVQYTQGIEVTQGKKATAIWESEEPPVSDEAELVGAALVMDGILGLEGAALIVAVVDNGVVNLGYWGNPGIEVTQASEDLWV